MTLQSMRQGAPWCAWRERVGIGREGGEEDGR